jgi:PAS domain S-box-containing protein
VENSDDAIITKNLDGIITTWNKGAQRIFGYTAAEAVGKPVMILIPEDRQHEEPAILTRVRSGDRVDHYETVRRRKDGTLLDVSLTISPVRDQRGEIVGASKIARDITELRRAREALQESHHELEKRVMDRTSSLREAIAQMEEFSYSVSHDLRAPVRAMQGYAKAVLEDYGEQIGEDGRNYLARIVRSGERMDRLVRDILTYSRVARAELTFRPIALNMLVEDIINQYPEMHPPRARIMVDQRLGTVSAHEASLGQAISNLLNNAVKFVASDVTPEVRVYSEERGEWIRLWVEDNGIGIRPDHQARLFGLFQRVHPDKKYEGTGIGLAVVRKSIERMGGRVGMESKGAGSKFWIELKRAL